MFDRTTLRSVLVVLTLLAGTLQVPLAAQDEDGPRFTIRPMAGGMVPTGPQRSTFETSALFGGQVGWRLTNHVSLVGSFAYAPTHERQRLYGDEVNTLSYDAGFEVRLPDAINAGSWGFDLFAGAGGGARTHRYTDRAQPFNDTNAAAYGTVGLDFAPDAGRFSLRLEARNYLSAFKGLRGEFTKWRPRHDMMLMGGIGILF